MLVECPCSNNWVNSWKIDWRVCGNDLVNTILLNFVSLAEDLLVGLQIG